MIVTIDGPAGAGKSTVSRRVAESLRVPYLNSGFIYRAITLLVLDQGGDFEDRELVQRTIDELDLDFEDSGGRTIVRIKGQDVTDRLKAPDVTPNVYRIANDGGYRERLVEYQRRFGEPPGVVAEGRDMGTVIFPFAEFKFYLDASPEERARRTLGDLQNAGHSKSFEEVLAETIRRDEHDRGREHAPLQVPEGAVVVDTDGLDIAGVVQFIVDQISGAKEPRDSGVPRRQDTTS